MECEKEWYDYTHNNSTAGAGAGAGADQSMRVIIRSESCSSSHPPQTTALMEIESCEELRNKSSSSSSRSSSSSDIAVGLRIKIAALYRQKRREKLKRKRDNMNYLSMVANQTSPSSITAFQQSKTLLGDKMTYLRTKKKPRTQQPKMSDRDTLEQKNLKLQREKVLV